MARLKNVIIKWVVLGVMLLGHPCFLFAQPFSLMGNWQYFKTGGDVEDTRTFSQSYNLDFSKDLTAGSYFSASARYNDIDRSEGTDSTIISPSAALDLRNDLFAMTLSGSASQRDADTRPTVTSKNWDVNWFSLIEDLPRLRLNYGQGYIEDDADPRTQDVETSYFGAGIDYEKSILRFLYDYRVDSNEDKVEGTTTDFTRHFGMVELTDSFLDNRLSVSVAQQVSYSETELQSSASQVFQARNISQAFAWSENDPLNTVSDTNSALINSVYTDSAVSIPSNPVPLPSFAVRVDRQNVDRIRVFFPGELSSAAQAGMTWSVYTSDSTASIINDWSPYSGGIDVNYHLEDLPEGTVTVAEIDLLGGAVSVNYIRFNLDTAEAVTLSEIEAGQVIFANGGSIDETTRNLDYQTRLNILYRPTDRLFFGYNLSRTRNEPDSGRDSTQLTQTLNANYQVSDTLSTGMGINENRDKAEGSPEEMTRSYSLSVSSMPLPTVDVSLGVTHTDRFEDKEKTSKADSLNGFVTTTLFPDLTASLSADWTKSTNYESDSETDTFSTRLTTRARLTRKLDVDAFYDYSSSELDTDIAEVSGKETANRFGGGANYRASEFLFVHGSFSRDVDNDLNSISTNASWQTTRKIQLDGRFALVSGEEDAQSWDAILNYSISPVFSFRSSYGVRNSDDSDSWNFFAGLSAVL